MPLYRIRRKMKLRKNHIIFAVAIALTSVFLALTLTGFLWNTLKTRSDLPVSGAVTVTFDGNVRYVTTNESELLAVSENNEILWRAELADRAEEVVVGQDGIYVCYNTDRTVVLFGRSGEKLAEISVPYAVSGIAVAGTELFVTATRNALSGSVIYRYERFAESDAYTSAAFTNAVIDVAASPTGTVYAVAKDYVVYQVKTTESGLSCAEYAVIPYEPIGLGFEGETPVVADVNGTVYWLKKGDVSERVQTGMTFCAFGASDGYAVGANVSGTVALFEGRRVAAKIASPTEIAQIAISDRGDVYLCEYRQFRTACISFGELGVTSFFAVAKWFFAVVFLIAGICVVVFAFRLTEAREARFRVWAKRFWIKLKRYFKSYMFLLPTFVLLVMFMYIPTVWSLFLSFFDYVPGVYTRFVGFDNFAAALSDSFFLGSVGNMLIFLVTDIIKALVPAIILAECIYALNSAKAQYWMRVLLYVPAVLPGVAVLLIWTKGVYGDSGLMNSILALFGGAKIDWLGNDKTSMLSLILVGFPWAGQYILFYGALMSVPDSLKESARLDGCNWVQGMWCVDFPLIMPQIKYIFITSFINSIQDFGRIYLTTGQTQATNIPALQMYMVLNSGNGYGKAAAMGVLLFVVVFAATYFNFRMQREERGTV